MSAKWNAICSSVRGDGSTQVDGLSDHDRQAHHVAVVGAEGTPDVRSHTVEGVGQLRHALRGHLSEGLCLLRCDEALLRQARDGLRQASAHSVHQIGAQVVERRLLVVVQERHFLAQQLISAHGIYLGQILGAGCTACVCCHVLLHSCHGHLLVGAQCHGPAAVEAQHALSIAGQYNAGKKT